MKLKFFIVFIVSILFNSCGGTSAEQESRSNITSVDKVDIQDGMPEPVFERTQFDFGNLIPGEKVTYSFRFDNQGNAPLIIYGVRSGCGCTVGDYPKEPLLPNESGRIKVDFNSTGRSGKQIQSVQVMTNANPTEYQLTVIAEVQLN
jgi:hypothetical protein